VTEPLAQIELVAAPEPVMPPTVATTIPASAPAPVSPPPLATPLYPAELAPAATALPASQPPVTSPVSVTDSAPTRAPAVPAILAAPASILPPGSTLVAGDADGGWQIVAPDDGPVAVVPHMSPRQRPGSVANRAPAGAWAARMANARPEGVWGTSPIAAERTVATIQNCLSCGLALSSNARFCRRCGTRQP